MVDFNDVLERPDVYKQAVVNKNSRADISKLVEVGLTRKKLLTELEAARAESNKHSATLKAAAQSGTNAGATKPSSEAIEKGRSLKEQIKQIEEKFTPIDVEFNNLLAQVPNLPSADTPLGKDDSENVVLRQWGQIRDFTKEGFEPLEHWVLGERLDVIDTERASKVSGSRFAYLKGGLVNLQFALMQFTLSKLTDEKFVAEVIKEAGLNLKPTAFTMVVPPVIINPEPFQRMARLEPREERYYIQGDDQYLIGSAEHTLGAMYMDETLVEAELPIRMLGYSTSFRREAGSYGKDTKGILRLHQFDKLEMEVFSTGETSIDEQNLLVALQEKMMQLLGLPYQVVICCTGDQGDPDARHLDIETWLPGQNRYRETHSADLMTDYQARRLNTRYKAVEGGTKLVHMNDATAFAVGRTLIAIMENYQNADGSITVPEALKPFAGISEISALGAR